MAAVVAEATAAVVAATVVAAVAAPAVAAATAVAVVAAAVAAVVVATAVSAAPTAPAPVAVAAVAAPAVVVAAATVVWRQQRLLSPALPGTQTKGSLGSLFQWAIARRLLLRLRRFASCVRGPCTARSSTALGSMRMILAITPICQGITR